MQRWRKATVRTRRSRLQNVIVDPESERIAAVIDWETDRSRTARSGIFARPDDLGIEPRRVLAGYGLKRGVPAMMRSGFFNVLNYEGASFARGQEERGPARSPGFD